jgi:hypothetical protein
MWKSSVAGSRGASNRGLEGIGTRMPTMWRRKRAPWRVITGKKRAGRGHGLEHGMTCAAAFSGPASAPMVRW